MNGDSDKTVEMDVDRERVRLARVSSLLMVSSHVLVFSG